MNQTEEPEIINKVWNVFKAVVLYIIPAIVGFLIAYYVRINLEFIFEVRSAGTLIFWFAILFLPLHFFAFRNKVKPLIIYTLKYFFAQYCVLLVLEIVASSYYGGNQSILDSLFRASLLANSLPAIVIHLVYSILRRQEDRLLKEYYYNQKKQK